MDVFGAEEIPSKKIKRITRDNMDEGRKKMKTEEEVVGSSGCDSRLLQLPHDVLLEVLTRLPIRKIFRCLCVSKFCRSILRSHQFSEAYRSSNPWCLVLCLPKLCEAERYEKAVGYRIDYCPLVESSDSPFEPYTEQFVNLFRVSFLDKEPRNDIPLLRHVGGVTQVVNGLFCYSYCNNQLLLLCNVLTRQTMRLPAPPGLIIGPSIFTHRYYFGFDPINGLYKLLSTRVVGRWITVGRTGEPKSNRHDYRVICEILTLGTDSSWRELPHDDLLPKCFLSGCSFDAICVKGVLYLMDYRARELHSFDLNKEKFRNSSSIPLFAQEKYPPCLVQHEGRPSLFFWMQNVMVLCTIQDNGNLTLQGRFPCDDDTTIIPVGNLPTGEILLAVQTTGSAFTPVYAFDRKKEKHQRFVVGKLPGSSNPRTVARYASCVEQNIAPLDAIIRIGRA